MELCRPTAFILLSIAVLVGGCGDQESASDPSASPSGDSMHIEASPAQPSNNVEAMMQAMAGALQREKSILNEAVDSLASVNDVDRLALREALQEQRRIGEQIEAMLRANPTWAETTCKWLASVVKPRHEEVLPLRLRLMKTKDPMTQENRFVQLHVKAFGSDEAMREAISWRLKAPGSPENLTIVCIKLGHIEDDGDKKR